MSVQDEVRAFRNVLWPLIKSDLKRVKWYYMGFIPPALMGRSLEKELRRELDKEEA